MTRAAAGLLLLGLAVPSLALKVERISSRPGAAAAGGTSGGGMDVVAEQVLVQFSSSSSAAQRASVLDAVGAREVADMPWGGWKVVSLPPGTRVADGIAALRGRSGIVMVQPNHVYYPTKTPNDPQVSQQYALSQIDAFAAWEFEVGVSCRVTVAMIDAGISPVPELAGKIITNGGTIRSQFFDPNSAGAQSPNDPPTPACNHATRTAGVSAASTDNGLGIAGLSWGANLISLKTFSDSDCNPSGDCPFTCGTTDASLANAINYAISINNTALAGKVVINMSIGGCVGPSPCTLPCPGACPGTDCFLATQTALNAAVAAGIPLAISAGNDGGPVNIPADCAGSTGGTGIMPVGATDSGNNIAAFSSRGPELSANGVVAPGVKVITSDLGGNFTSASGTSFSAPHVAGLAALILSARPDCRGQNCALYAQNVIRASADRIGAGTLGLDAGGQPLGNTQGAGRINAFKALRLTVNGTLADFAGEKDPIAFPNPFRVAQHRIVSFALPPSLQGGPAKIRIFTLAGQLVREVAGLTWDGVNKDGNAVASGTYLFVVDAGGSIARGRFALIR